MIAVSETNFNITLSRLDQLLQEDQEDEYGAARPTHYAYAWAKDLLCRVESLLQGTVLRASVATDTEGGVHFYWKSSGREVQLALPSQEAGACYIYRRWEGDSDIQTEVTAQVLATALGWLCVGV